VVKLRTSSGEPIFSTVKELLLGLPASHGMVTHFLFQNIEPQVNSEFYLAVYAVENEALLEERLKSLTRDILSLLAPGEGDKFFVDPNRGFIFGRDIRQYVTIDSMVPSNTSPSSAMQLQRLNQLVRTPSVKRNSTAASSPPRSTRTRPTESTARASTNITSSFSSITQCNTTSYSTPTTSYSSRTSNTEVSITIERRFVNIETNMREQKQQQIEMNTKLNVIDEVATESNILIKQLLENMKLTPTRGAKRDKPDENVDRDIDMNTGGTNP
jgi:hypothetical protein